MSDFCPDCGIEHHWLACPEVTQSMFLEEDPETALEELDELAQELASGDVLDPIVRRMMERHVDDLLAFVAPHGTSVAPWESRRGQKVSYNRTCTVETSTGTTTVTFSW